MPEYKYKCVTCGPCTIKKSVHDDTKPRCPECGIVLVKRIYDTPGISFKGSGFYSTDKGKK